MPQDPGVDTPLVELPGSGYVYETGWHLATTDIDEHMRLRLDGVARYIQEVGAEHLADANLADVHPHWIVLRTVIDVLEPIELPSDITFRRWCAALSTRWCSMRVQLQGADGGRIETEVRSVYHRHQGLQASSMSRSRFQSHSALSKGRECAGRVPAAHAE